MNLTPGWILALLGDATPSPSPSGNEPDPSLVSPGWLGLASLVFLSVTLFLLWKSMNRQFKRIDFDEAATERPARHADEPTPPPAQLPADAPSESPEFHGDPD